MYKAKYYLLAGLVLMMLYPLTSFSHSMKVGKVGVGHAWAPLSSQKLVDGRNSIDVYLPMLNNGSAPEALVGAEAVGAEEVVLVVSAGNSEMTLAPVLALPPGKPVSLSPHGKFLRLMGMSKPVVAGDRIPLTLRFEKSGEGKMDVFVEEKASD